jgi:hypothetical protein
MTGGTGSVVAFASAAAELCRQEIARIRNAMVPTILKLQDDARESIYYAKPPRLELGGTGLVSTA